MAECSKCGKQEMTFTCKYCGKKFCSEHRIPENHDCDSMEEELEKEKEEKEENQWFQEQEVRKPATTTAKVPEKPSLIGDIKNTFTNNYTLSIIAVTVFVFGIQVLLGDSPRSSQFYSLFVLDPNIENVISQPWTLISVLFIHGGLFHLFANMVTFYFFGTPVERAIGAKNFLKFYFGAGIAASLGFVLFRNFLALYQGPELLAIPAVGASGAVVAMFGVVAMLYPRAEVLLYFIVPMKIRTAVYLFAGLEGVNLFTKAIGYTLPLIGNVSSAAHLTGLAIGLWYGKKLQDRYSKNVGVFDPLGH